MRLLIATALAATGIAVAIVSTNVASQTGPSTIEGCSALLPQGKTYTFEIKGSIDTSGPAPRLSGEMSVSDGTEVDNSTDVAAFGECISKFIR